MAIQVENIRGRKSTPPVHFSVTDLHRLDRKQKKSKIKF